MEEKISFTPLPTLIGISEALMEITDIIETMILLWYSQLLWIRQAFDSNEIISPKVLDIKTAAFHNVI